LLFQKEANVEKRASQQVVVKLLKGDKRIKAIVEWRAHTTRMVQPPGTRLLETDYSYLVDLNAGDGKLHETGLFFKGYSDVVIP
jgi:hypothetical protein